MRRIAEDPHGFILRKGWAALDFDEEREIAQLRRLWESRFDRLKALSLSKGIELEIIRVLEAGHALKESPDYELHRLTTQTPAFFDETVRRNVESLEKEMATLESEVEDLAKEIEELTGEAKTWRSNSIFSPANNLAPPVDKPPVRGFHHAPLEPGSTFHPPPPCPRLKSFSPKKSPTSAPKPMS